MNSLKMFCISCHEEIACFQGGSGYEHISVSKCVTVLFQEGFQLTESFHDCEI